MTSLRWTITDRRNIIVALFVLALYLPFLNKAFHIDDSIFIDASRMIGLNPLHAQAEDYHYSGAVLKDFLPYDITHPLLIPYLIKVFASLFGYGEVGLHLFFMVFPLLSILGMALLCTCLLPERKGVRALLVIFTLASPAFLVNSHNIMTDVPTTAFVLTSVGLFCLSMERQRVFLSYLGGAALTAAVFSSYTAIAFLPLVFLYALFRRELTRHTLLALCLPPAALFGWFLAVYSVHDIFPILKSGIDVPGLEISAKILRGLRPGFLAGKAVSFFTSLGTSTLPVLLLSAIVGRRQQALAAFFFASLMVSLAVAWTFAGYSTGANILLSLQLAAGLSALAFITFVALEKKGPGPRGPRLFLLAWVYLVFLYCMAVMPFGAARYMIPALPPAFMILLGSVRLDATVSPKVRSAVGAAVLLAALTGLAGAYSDYRFAGTYRTLAAHIASLQEAGSGEVRIWYVGEWGFRHYMERIGARHLTRYSNEPAPGDLIVVPEMPSPWPLSRNLRQRLAFQDRRQYSSPFPLRLFNGRSHAGFYAHVYGLLSFAVSRQPDEVIWVYRVSR